MRETPKQTVHSPMMLVILPITANNDENGYAFFGFSPVSDLIRTLLRAVAGDGLPSL
jgi:hypothetical protein